MSGKGNHQEEIQDHIMPQHNKRPHLKRIHHSWWFWIFLGLMLAGILYYIMSVDFAFAPHRQIKQPVENNGTP